MGRRIKEPGQVHREKIASAAERLFFCHGIESTSMNQIADEAGYSKATLYVYFANKEDIIGFLVLKSMKTLLSFLQEAVAGSGSSKEKYNRICLALINYQEQYPLYFHLALGEINVDFEREDYLPVEKEIYEVGEQINAEIGTFLRTGICNGDFKPDIPVEQTAFLFWAALAGVIQMAENKRIYLKKAMNLSKQQFTRYGVDLFYKLIAEEE